MNDLRSLITSGFEDGSGAEGAVVTPIADAPSNDNDLHSPDAAAKARDEQGRFARHEEKPNITAEAPKADATTQPQDVAPTDAQSVIPQSAPAARPVSWKKEFQPTWDKLNTGIPLTPEESKKLAAYNTQREGEYAAGISQYKTIADGAKHLTDVVQPYSGLFQQYGINAPTLLQSMLEAHKVLALGSLQEKLQRFSQLAQEYGIPLNAVAQNEQGALDPNVMHLMQETQSVKEQLAQVAQWRNQQETQAVNQQVEKFNDAEKYPYFQDVRNEMADLLQNGAAKDLDDAYLKAVRFNPNTYDLELNRVFAERQAKQGPAVNSPSKAQAAQAAKAATVSTRTVTPSGATKPADPKDLRAALAANFDSALSGRL